MSDERAHWQMSTSWNELQTVTMPGGAVVTHFSIGPPEDKRRPAFSGASYPPGFIVAPQHAQSPTTPRSSSKVQQITRRWHHAGDIQVVQGGTVYGPLVAGPEGVTVLVIFRDNRWQAIPVDADNSGMVWIPPELLDHDRMTTTLVIGGTGPTGPLVVEGLLAREHEVTVLHTGRHEVEYSAPVAHIHADPNFKEPQGRRARPRGSTSPISAVRPAAHLRPTSCAAVATE